MNLLRIALAQMNATVGGLKDNVQKIREAIIKAKQSEAHLIAFPELAICGYPPEDLLLKPAFIRACRKALDEIIPLSDGIIVIVGFPEEDGKLYNSVAVLYNKKLIATYRKHCLPNYGVFDEDRYFVASNNNLVFVAEDFRFGVSICEDIWQLKGPPLAQALQGNAQLLVNVSASPYHQGKGKTREAMLASRAVEASAAIAFCNLIGGQDELVFDGGSVVFDSHGTLLARSKPFEEELLLADLPLPTLAKKGTTLKEIEIPFKSLPKPKAPLPKSIADPLENLDEIYQALVLGTKDYIRKNGFKKVVLGLSGGIDSSLVACIAVDALSASNVIGVSMPSQYSSEHSREDAAILAKALNIKLLTLPIESVFQAYTKLFEPVFSEAQSDITEENLQSRIRGTLMMALSNKFGWLVLTTGNKSEMSVGYATLYGDMAGGFAVIKDVPKILVYELAKRRNALNSVIPERVFTKPPSAELRPNQKDSDSLPDYAVLDPILYHYIEENWGLAEFLRKGYSPDVVKKVIEMVDRAEYKRRQAPPGIKITPRALGKDWRLPLTNLFTEEL